MKVLIVDDEESIRRLVGDFLRDCGHDVATATEGFEAVWRRTRTSASC